MGVLRAVESAKLSREERVWVARLVDGALSLPVLGGVREVIMGMGW